MRSAWLFLVLLACSSLGSFATETEWIPFTKGTYWIYEGDVGWVEANPATGQNQVYNKHLTWRSEVTDVVRGDHFTAALVHGSPFDLPAYSSKAQPQDHLFLLIGTDYYEVLQNPVEVFQILKKGPQNWPDSYDALNQAEELFPTPLAEGKTFGGTPSEFMERKFYSVVQGVTPFSTRLIKGAPPLKNPACYGIEFRENTDNSETDIVPGIGIVGYVFSHHGTTMEVDVHLIAMGHAP